MFACVFIYFLFRLSIEIAKAPRKKLWTRKSKLGRTWSSMSYEDDKKSLISIIGQRAESFLRTPRGSTRAPRTSAGTSRTPPTSPRNSRFEDVTLNSGQSRPRAGTYQSPTVEILLDSYDDDNIKSPDVIERCQTDPNGDSLGMTEVINNDTLDGRKKLTSSSPTVRETMMRDLAAKSGSIRLKNFPDSTESGGTIHLDDMTRHHHPSLHPESVTHREPHSPRYRDASYLDVETLMKEGMTAEEIRHMQLEIDRDFEERELEDRRIQDFTVLVSNVPITNKVRRVDKWPTLFQELSDFIAKWHSDDEKNHVDFIVLPHRTKEIEEFLEVLKKKKWAHAELNYLEALGITSGPENYEPPTRFQSILSRLFTCCHKEERLSDELQKKILWLKYKNKYDKYCARIRVLKMQIFEREYNRKKEIVQGHVFFLFSNLAHAKHFTATLNDKKKLNEIRNLNPELFDTWEIQNWTSWRCPHPSDINFKMISITRFEFYIRFTIINILLLGGLLIFTAPASIASSLARDSDNIEAIRDLEGAERAIVKFFLSNLPTLILLIVGALVPIILTETSALEGHRSKSKLDRSICRKIFLYLLVLIFIFPTLLSSSATVFTKFFTEDRSISDLLEDLAGVYTSCTTFIILVLQNAFVSALIQVLNIPQLLRGFFMPPKKPLQQIDEERRAPPKPWQVTVAVPYEYGFQYAVTMVIFTIVLFYSPVCPLILPCGLAFFVIRRYSDKYNLLHVFPFAYEGDMVMARTVISFMLIAMLFWLLGMFTFFLFTREAARQSTVCLVFFFIFLAFLILINLPIKFLIRNFYWLLPKQLTAKKLIAIKREEADEDTFFLKPNQMRRIKDTFYTHVFEGYFGLVENPYHDDMSNKQLRRTKFNKHFDIFCCDDDADVKIETTTI
eukprot:TRINITY_DN7817_c0_g1_i1.p1 TRINITY_DN7817_c0_g1~~TRINITY_DN7817_c0_g1_i1.p1  ORF type:complete len:902 (+),score=224.49 TRINITY_DN7817_c0_g1_i1:494-3199(+)